MPRPNRFFLTIFWLLTLGLGFLGGALARPYFSNLRVATNNPLNFGENSSIKKQNPELDRFLKDFLQQEENQIYLTSKLINEDGISPKILPKLLELIFVEESTRQEAVSFLIDEENEELEFIPSLMSQIWEDRAAKLNAQELLARDYQLYPIPPTEENEAEISELMIQSLVELCPEQTDEESLEAYQERIQGCDELVLLGALRDRALFYKPPFQVAYDKVLVSTPLTPAQPEEGQAYTCEDPSSEGAESSPYFGKRILLTSLQTDGTRTKEFDVTQTTFECPESGSMFHLNPEDAIELFDVLEEVNKVQVRIIDSML
ncbi:MAG: hypothetical protein SWY16_16590 [Cyanobacteriota bacterium]|nr:hypothetical protein [Cyanobacteriota bacterium]